MSDSITVSTQVLLDTAKKIRDNINPTMAAKLNEINKRMNDLEASWKSDAANDIREAMNALKPRFEEYKQVVDSYARFLDTAAQHFETTEQTIQSNANAFK